MLRDTGHKTVSALAKSFAIRPQWCTIVPFGSSVVLSGSRAPVNEMKGGIPNFDRADEVEIEGAVPHRGTVSLLPI